MKRHLSSLAIVTLLCCLILTPQASAHDYSAPFFYMAGVYSTDSKPYPPASDAEMKWLLKQIADDDKDVRSVAAGALGQTGDARAAEPLIQALGDKATFVRMNAAMGFVHIKDPRAVQPLAVIFAEPGNDYGAMAAGYALAAQGDEGIAALLSGVEKLASQPGADGNPLADLSQFVMVAKGLDAIDWAVAQIKGNNAKTWPGAVSIITYSRDPKDEAKARVDKAFADPAFGQGLLNVVLNAEPKTSYEAGALICESRNAALIDKLKAAAKDATGEKGDSLRDMLSRCLGSGQNAVQLDDAAIARLAKTIETTRHMREEDYDPSLNPAFDAAEALAASDNPKAIAALVKLMRDKRPAVAEVAQRAMEGSENPLVLKALLKIANDKRDPCRTTAVWLLLQVKKPAMVPFFISLLKDKDEHTVEDAIQGLGALKDRRATRPLIALLTNARYAGNAMQALGQIGDPAAIDSLLPLLSPKKSSPKYLQQEAAHALADFGTAAVAKLLPKIKSADPGTRKAAADILFNIHDPRITDALIPALADKNTAAREAVVRALIEQKDPKAVADLVPILKDASTSVRLAAACAMALSPKASFADALAPLLKDKDAGVRKCAGVALAQLGNKRGTAAVLAVLNPNPDAEGSSLLLLPAIRGAGVLKETRAVTPILGTLGEDVNMSVFGATPEERLQESRKAKIDALRAITGQDFGNAYYRWMAYWIAQGHSLPSQDGGTGETY